MNDLIIARYKEDVSWIDDNNLSDKFNVIVYNKFYDEPKTLPNVPGRESHTYFWHIIDRYDTLADRTIFCQGDPFDHSPNFVDLANKVDSDKDLDFFPMSRHRGEGDDDIDYLHCDIDGKPDHPTLGMQTQFYNIFGDNAIVPDPIIFYPGAVFCCSKENIHKRPLEFYTKCYDLSLNDEWTDTLVHATGGGFGNKCCGYFFERFWSYIFNHSKIEYVNI